MNCGLRVFSEAWLWGVPIGLVWAAYPATHWLLGMQRRYAMLEDATQRYIVSNLIKTGTLMMFSAPLVSMVGPLLLRGEIQMDTLRTLAPVYAALDIVSLWMVPNMKNTTLCHHVAVGLTAALIRYDQNIVLGSLSGALCVYGLFSMLAYFVNGFLAMRYLVSPESRGFLARAAWLSGAGYIAVCAVHWPYQLWLSYRHGIWGLPLMMAIFVVDDIDLIRYLLQFTLEKTVVVVTPNGFALGVRDSLYETLVDELGEPVTSKHFDNNDPRLQSLLDKHYSHKSDSDKRIYLAEMSGGPVEVWCFEGVSAVRRAQKIHDTFRQRFHHNTMHVSNSVEAGESESCEVGWFST